MTWTQEGLDEITRRINCTLLRVLGCLHAGSIVEWADGTTRRQGDACPMWILHDQPQLAIPSGVALQIRKRIMPLSFQLPGTLLYKHRCRQSLSSQEP